MSMIGRRSVATSLSGSPGGIVSWQALDDAVAGKHASIDREVSADHKSTHGCILLGQAAGFVCKIRLVLAAIDQNQASIAARVAVALVHGVHPPTTPAKAFQVLHVEATHRVN
jgi:hypothetical protein